MGKKYIYSGDGHGKTPTALGMAVWMACRGKSVVIIQFLMGKGQEESEFMRRLEPEIKLFCFEKTDENFALLSQEQRQEEAGNIRNGLNFAKKVLTTGECDLLILDEVLGLIDNHIITVEELKNLLEAGADTDMDIVMTGIMLNDEVCRLADEVTKMEKICVK